MLIGRSAEGLKETEKLISTISQDVQILSIPLDVTDELAVNKAFEDIHAKFGTPHVLVNNAGAINPVVSLVDSKLDSWWNTHVSERSGTMYLL